MQYSDDELKTLYRVINEYEPEERSYMEDVKREETFRRVKIPREVIREIFIEAIKEDEGFLYRLYRPFFRIVSLTTLTLALVGIIYIGLVVPLVWAFPFIITALFSIYSYFHFKS